MREGGLWAEARFYGPAELEALLSRVGAVRIDYCVHVPPQLGWLPGPLMDVLDWLLRRVSPANGALIGARVAKGR
jgi:hypothetical protein